MRYRWRSSSGLTSIKLVDTAHPLETARGQVVESNEVVVAGKAVDGADADLVKSPEEILGNVDGLLEVLHPDVDVCTHIGGGLSEV